jgi:hypothetical protein
MATQTVANAVRQWLIATLPAVTFRWENEAADPPTSQTTWAFVEITGDVFDQQSIGAGARASNRWLEAGTLFIHVFAPSGAGTADARTLAEQIATAFRTVETLSPNITFGRMSLGLGDVEAPDGNWWRLPMTIAWEREI